MLRYSTLAVMAAALLVAACSEPPTAPSPSAASATPSGASARPDKGGGPNPTPHDLSFAAPVVENDGITSLGYVDAGQQEVSGWITGPNASGYFKASAVAPAYTMTLTSVGPNPLQGGTGCTADEQDFLASVGLVGAAVTGTLSLSVDEDTAGSVQGPTMVWELAGIPDPGGAHSWTIVGGSGSVELSTFPQFDDSSTQANLVVTVENGRANFSRYPNGQRGKKVSADLFIKCRVDLTMTMAK